MTYMNIRRVFIFMAVIFLISVAFVFATNVIIYITTKSYIYHEISKARASQTAIILGAQVLSKGRLSPVLKDRVDTAITLYEAKKVANILVSGDNATASYNEVNPVRIYLLEKGVLEKDIFLDHAGFDTYSTMYRARNVFNVSSVLIVSQPFHLPRAVFIARSLSVDAYGVSALSKKILFRNYVREIFANVKAMFDLIFNVKPKYLGTPQPIHFR